MSLIRDEKKEQKKRVRVGGRLQEEREAGWRGKKKKRRRVKT